MKTNSKDIHVDIKEDGINEIIDESTSSNSFIALRELRWKETSEYRLDLRKWFTSSDGEEIPGKGVSFVTERGPHQLTEILVNNGFGNTNVILNSLLKREDLDSKLSSEISSYIGNINIDSQNDGSYYDPKEIL